MRVRTGGSHHQKFVVLRHHERPELDIGPAVGDVETVFRDLHDLAATFTTFADCAAKRQRCHDGGCQGTRLPGRLRPVNDEALGRFTRIWATPFYRLLYDPDGRPLNVRVRLSF